MAITGSLLCTFSRDASQRVWHLVDNVKNELYECDGDEMLSKGLYVALEGWDYHFFHLVQSSNGINIGT
jgi:hypothetical protein